MTNKKSRSSRARKRDANRRLPNDLVPLLREALLSLPNDRRTEYLRASIFSKFVSSETDPPNVRRQRAINKWLAAEQTNAATNERLLLLDTKYGDFNILPRVKFSTFMDTVRRFIQDILGELPPADVILGSFSGGASTSRRRTESHPAHKYIGKADVTRRAFGYIDQLMIDTPLWSAYRDEMLSSLSIVPGNILFTVPKTTEIDRCAAKEPDLNMYMQKGVGDFISSRLRKFGIDLSDQSRNRNLARLGSINNDLATLDLSSASDSICRELVFQCVPTHWFVLLDSLRSDVTIIDGDEHVNEMFSSMGNGFTFELETCLFYAIARATAYHTGTSGVISVYGDDIIVPSEMADLLIFVLQTLGFSTNVDKSFVRGDFRESCGGHFINGRDVTPFYVKKPIITLIDLIHLCNSIREWADLKSGLPILDPRVEDIWLQFASMVPFQFWGGHDTSDKYRLVSGWKPKQCRRLVAVKAKKQTGLGGYLHWHDSQEHNSVASDSVTSSYSVELNMHRVKPVRYVRNPDCLFLHELED